MNDKVKKATELLEGIKSVVQPISGEVMVVMTCDEWDKVMQAESLLRSISLKSCSNCGYENTDCPYAVGGKTICEAWLPKPALSPEQLKSMSEHIRQLHSPSDKPKGHTPDCDFTLDGSACSCRYRTAPKPETFLKPAKNKCTLCFGHSAMMDSCTRCGGSGKEPPPAVSGRRHREKERGLKCKTQPQVKCR